MSKDLVALHGTKHPEGILNPWIPLPGCACNKQGGREQFKFEQQKEKRIYLIRGKRHVNLHNSFIYICESVVYFKSIQKPSDSLAHPWHQQHVALFHLFENGRKSGTKILIKIATLKKISEVLQYIEET